MSENAVTGIGSSTAPTTCSRPLGASVPISASQSSFTLTVLIRRSRLPASFPIAAESLLETTELAPKPFASSNLLALDVNAVTSQPYAAANFTAMCPSPPMPMMPTRSVGLANLASGAKTVIPPAQERPGVGEVQLFRQRDGPGPVRADVTREPAAMTDDRCLRLRAKVMASRHALVAVHAATGDPADADTLSDLESLGIRTYSRDSTDDLVAENRGVLRHAPVIVQDGEIGVTQTAVFDGDFNVLGPERSEINGFEHHRLFGRLRDPCLIIHRVSYSETSAGLDGGWLVAALG